MNGEITLTRKETEVLVRRKIVELFGLDELGIRIEHMSPDYGGWTIRFTDEPAPPANQEAVDAD